KPVITLLGDASVTVECHTSYTDGGATASDGCAGDLTSQILSGSDVNVNVPGTYHVTYNVSDPAGNPADEVTRTVVVSDTVKPVITLTGPASVTLQCHVDSYTEQGASVSDACDTTLTAATVGGDVVNVNAPGTYVVTYNANDASGNAAIQVTRTVTVEDTIKPIITRTGPASLTLQCHVENYTEQGASVSDACDIALTAATVGGDVVDR